MSNVSTVIGHLGGDPELRYTPQGKAVVTFNVADTPRSLDRTSGQWVDGETHWVKVTAWNDLAENIQKSVQKGDKVIVIGAYRAEKYQDKTTGETKTSLKLVATEVAPSLTGATANVEKRRRNETNGGAITGNSTDNNAPAEDDDTPF